MEKVFYRIREIMIELPGAIIGLGKLEPITKGWVVKLKNGQNFEGDDGLADALEIAKISSKKVAGWKDGDIELWDVVEVFDNEAEATEFGKVMEQMTIYQIETGLLKWLD